jgi:hypothetical protein
MRCLGLIWENKNYIQLENGAFYFDIKVRLGYACYLEDLNSMFLPNEGTFAPKYTLSQTGNNNLMNKLQYIVRKLITTFEKLI